MEDQKDARRREVRGQKKISCDNLGATFAKREYAAKRFQSPLQEKRRAYGGKGKVQRTILLHDQKKVSLSTRKKARDQSSERESVRGQGEEGYAFGEKEKKSGEKTELGRDIK